MGSGQWTKTPRPFLILYSAVSDCGYNVPLPTPHSLLPIPRSFSGDEPYDFLLGGSPIPGSGNRITEGDMDRNLW